MLPVSQPDEAGLCVVPAARITWEVACRLGSAIVKVEFQRRGVVFRPVPGQGRRCVRGICAWVEPLGQSGAAGVSAKARGRSA